MNSCKAYVDRVWDEGEAFGEGGGGTLQEKDRDTRADLGFNWGVQDESRMNSY